LRGSAEFPRAWRRPAGTGGHGVLVAAALALAVIALPGPAQAQPPHKGGTDRAVATSQLTQCQGGPCAPSISSSASIGFALGEVNSFTVTASGDPSPTLNESGPLPSGVLFTDNGVNANGDDTATLAGIPAAGTLGTYPITITADNGVGVDATQDFVLTVGVAPAITTNAAASFVVGSAGSFSMVASGSPDPTFSETGPLPEGVTLAPDGTLDGTPASGSAGTYPLNVMAANGVVPDATQSFLLTVDGPPAITSLDRTRFVLGAPHSFTVTTFGVPTPSLSASGTLPSGVSFTDNGDGTATLAGTPSTGTSGFYPITLTAANGWGPDATQSFFVLVGTPPAITSAASTTFTEGSVGSFTFQADGFPAADFSESGWLPNGVTLGADGILAGSPGQGSEGTYPITVTASNGFLPSATQVFVLVVDGPPSIASTPGAAFVTGLADSFTVTATGVPLPALSETGTLPEGVTFTDNGNGTATVAGTAAPGTAGTYPMTVTADNGVAPNATENYVVSVYAPLVFTSADSAVFTQGSPGTFSFQTSGSPAPSFSARGAFPAGVTLSSDGVLSGTPGPGTSGTYLLEVEASNGYAPAVTQSFILGVTGPPTITSNSDTLFEPGQAGSFNIETKGYPEATVSETGPVPPGLTFTTHGTLFGTPAVGSDGAYPITVTATNGQPPDATQAFTIYVGFAIFNTSLPGGNEGQRYSARLTTIGGTVRQWSLVSGALPRGLRLNRNTGVISGRARSTGTFMFAVKVTSRASKDQASQTDSIVLSIAIS
jgi:hypothetical protein